MEILRAHRKETSVARSFIKGFPARKAVNAKSLSELQRALDAGASPNAIARIHPGSNYGKATLLLHRAVELRWIPGVELLLKYGADPELRSGSYSATALFMAADSRNPEMMASLVSAGASVQGLGWALDFSSLNEKSSFSELEYSHVGFVEMTVLDLVKSHRDPEERRALLSGVADRSEVHARPRAYAPKI